MRGAVRFLIRRIALRSSCCFRTALCGFLFQGIFRIVFPADLVSRARLRSSLSLLRFLLYPGLRARFQNRIYKLVTAANSHLRPRGPLAASRVGFPQNFVKRGHLEWRNERWERVTSLRTKAAHRSSKTTMQTPGDAGNSWGSYYRSITGAADPPEGGREPGGRRKKLAGYLKAANELRQSYYSGYTARSAEMDKEYNDTTGDQPSSSWPEVEVMRSGDEELVLFPSYARRRPEKPVSRRNAAGGNERIGRFEDTRARDSSEEDWANDEQTSSTEEDDNLVDVDVRGWLFAPHSGPLTRKNRYLHWVALKLCGLPAQASTQPGEPDRNPTAEEVELTKETAAAIAKNGRPPSIYPTDEKLEELTRTNSAPVNAAAAAAAAAARRLSWRPTAVSSPSSQSLSPQQQQQPQLSPAEIASAHTALSARLAPFMHRPIPGTPITIFFFNSNSSQSRTLVTTETGHFAVRVALPFIPTHVRVLASETLSATEEVIVHTPLGISLLSDIDDTVKHSAVSMGAREIFRNTFTAPLSTLSIPGVADWYTRLAGAPYNVNFHYVSNSPWQLYPLLKTFFQEAGLPAGSMHLKQYSGMLQGIFEPVAERKKGTVERVFRDFPQRQWILVGDSGEADLEVYTEIVEKFPGKVLAVFIRDITTTPAPDEKGFFDSNESEAEYSRAMQEWADEKAASIKEAEAAKVPPPIPPKRRSGNSNPQNIPQGELVHDQFQRPGPGTREPSTSTVSTKSPPPPKPPKPVDLRAMRTTTAAPVLGSTTQYTSTDPPERKGHSAPSSPPPPPLPRRTATFSGAVDGQSPATPFTMPNATSLSQSLKPSPSPPSPSPSMTAQQQQQLQQQEILLSKREELWNRRWERALMIMGQNGVLLKSWRTGGDVEVICRSIVEEALWGK